ncbi:hypothetical protein BDV96DRAFT_497984 [Lophiotrema nucula]|uniref:Zn(2)-C6 fungal-type domain-containing protein n=1 Tax=Lophiotrema nucula TaxID=690887 RepID=A0A6A5Z074_9PLEO|nr:hypothetical protein BDV96DRAFT_497984 [Lophiotrema nucula]
MPTRLAACEPCRSSKVACDHARPVCSRCIERDCASNCSYRTRPFKKRKHEEAASTEAAPSSQRDETVEPAGREDSVAGGPFSAKSRVYPNPGYLGSSSHTTFFSQLPPDDTPQVELHGKNVDDSSIADGAQVLERLRSSFDITSSIQLFDAWISRGVNLALAGTLTQQCADTAKYVIHGPMREVDGLLTTSKSLFANTCRPLQVTADSTLANYCAQFCNGNARWESLGIFFTSICRAAADVPRFEPLYRSEQQRQSLQRIALQLSDRCLNIALSVDYLNDLQLLLQYENYIIHTYMDGDQSYASWRRLGDVVSSLFALGYHEQVEDGNALPQWLKDLRQGAFARAYSANTNVSIFLGRPPRMNRKYCHFNFLGVGIGEGSLQPPLWRQDGQFDYLTDTKWSALCALLKEEILDLSRERLNEERSINASRIEAAANALWDSLPRSYHLEGPLKMYDRSPVERDFLISARLNHIHIFFMLHMALQRRTTDPDAPLIKVSAQILSLVCEAVLLKDTLANSGTTLVWKVAYYGLAAAGIVCLSLINRSFPEVDGDISATKAVQDLSVLVAQVETGALVHVDDPNHALLTKATVTIKSLLNRLLSAQLAKPPPDLAANASLPLDPLLHTEGDWIPWDTQNWQDFEVDFWSNLAEHPFLTGPGAGQQPFP